MQDFHLFRLYEFERCVHDLQIPCGWAPDVGFEYGEPVFNFYGQFPYFIGQLFLFTGFSKIDAIKILFILSLAGSAISMYYLARKIWGDGKAALLSSIVYLYAPYRSVDVWVRGALSESLAFVLFPLIVLTLHNFISTGKVKMLMLFSLLLAILILTHNLSVLMLLLFIVPWLAVTVVREKRVGKTFYLLPAVLFSLLLSAFYVLPVIFDANLVHLNYTTTGYFDFRGHFATIYQLLLSGFWGYGASVFGPEDGLSLSVGQLQWIIPLLAVILLFFKKDKHKWQASVLVLIGWVALFLTHNKSAFIWEKIPFFAYLQFPWRWLTIALFSFSLASGSILLIFKKHGNLLGGILILLIILMNVSFFKEDIWYKINDTQQFSGEKWEQQIASSVGDYWPSVAPQYPKAPARGLFFIDGQGSGRLTEKTSNKISFTVRVDSENSTIQLPVVYYPGWEAKIDGKITSIKPSGNYGLITLNLETGDHIILLNFLNTMPRRVGSIVSALSFTIFLIMIFKMRSKNVF